jgi:hypothetical protein
VLVTSRSQPSGSPRAWWLLALRNATVLAIAVAGCAKGSSPEQPGPDASADAPAHHPDSAPDGAVAPDAPLPDSPACAISQGVTPVLDGVNDLADYPAGQLLTPGAMLGSDGAAFSWDPQKLYVTVQSSAFASAYEPLHIYVETGDTLAAATPAQGKEYSSLIPQLPFTPTHLIAVRRVSDAGTGPYDGVFIPDAQWTTRATALTDGIDVFAANDEMSVEVPWAALGGCPRAMRLAIHVVHAQPANEWKDLVPATHTPWQAPGGDFYELDLTAAPGVTLQ